MTRATENMCTEEYDPITEEDLEDPAGGGEPPPDGFEPEEAESALEALTPALRAIPPDELRPFNVGAPAAVGLGLAYADAYAEDRQIFVEHLTQVAFDPVAHDDLEQRAMAFWQADIQMRQELGKDGPFRLLVLEGKPLRAKMLKSAIYLWGEDPNLGDVVAAIRKGTGYTDAADDLGALAALFADNWDLAEGKCDVTREDIDRAKVIGAEMLQALSPSRSEELDDARLLRLRAAEHLRRGMEEVRDAAKYLFRDDPASLERYPSLFVLGRKRRSGGKAAAEAGDDVVPAVPSSEPTAAEPGAEAATSPGQGVETSAPEA